MSNLWVIIPAFNEELEVAEVVESVRQRFERVVVVDDGSSDRTGGQALAAGAIVITHSVNLGQGAAIKTGIDFALKHNADFIATFDADGQHQAEDLVSLFNAIKLSGVDVVLGSRMIGSAEGMPITRRLLLYAAIGFSNFTTGIRLTDTHNGIRIFSRFAAEKIDISQDGMAHASEILHEIARLGLSFTECPVTVRYTDYSRRKGQSAFGAIRIVLDLIIGKLR